MTSARRRLSQLGSLLKLNQHCIDTALGFFKMALQLNLTRGRKSSIMDTACLYLVCRSEGTPRIIILSLLLTQCFSGVVDSMTFHTLHIEF